MLGSSRIALVTGGGSGIGRAVALALAEAGWHVAVAGRRLDALEATAGLAASGAIMPLAADVTQAASVDALFSAIATQHGRLDLLFNNAGVNAPKVPLDDLDVDDLRNVIEVNLIGAILCARAAMRLMKKQVPQGGRIINNGSVSAYAPRPHAAPYTASKHAITGLTKSIALDGRGFNIVCGQIDIGNVATDMTLHMPAGTQQPDGTMVVEPQFQIAEVGRAISHMASLPPEANVPFMTLMASAMPLYGRG